MSVKASTFQKSNPMNCLVRVLKPEPNNWAQARNGQPTPNDKQARWLPAVYRKTSGRESAQSKHHEMMKRAAL